LPVLIKLEAARRLCDDSEIDEAKLPDEPAYHALIECGGRKREATSPDQIPVTAAQEAGRSPGNCDLIFRDRHDNLVREHSICAWKPTIMDLLHALHTFVRVTETGSFSAVARETDTSHSSVTRQVGDLEEHFGVRLFQRTTRHLSLTEDGQDLLQHAQRMIELAEDLEGALGRQRVSPNGLVRIGVTTAGATLMTPRLRGLMDDYPGLSIELVVRDQLGDLIEERLDIALHVGQPPDSSLMARRVGAFGRVLVAAPTYLERRGAPARPTDVANHDCVIHEYGPESTQWHFKGPDGPETIRVQGRFHANNAAIVRRAVLDGYGVAMVPEALIVDDVRSARLYRLLPDYQTERLPAFLLYPSRRHLAPRTRLVIESIAQETAKIAARLAEDDVWGSSSDGAWLV
jgi:DNA-binding transcriptional LysR family regulator